MSTLAFALVSALLTLSGTQADSVPPGITDICSVANGEVLLVFLGEGATDRCNEVWNPGQVGPGGWTLESNDVMSAMEVPICAFRTFGADSTHRVLMRVYAGTESEDGQTVGRQICTGRTQFFPNADDIAPE